MTLPLGSRSEAKAYGYERSGYRPNVYECCFIQKEMSFLKSESYKKKSESLDFEGSPKCNGP